MTQKITVSQIIPTRTHVDRRSARYATLRESIGREGIRQPIRVGEVGNGKYKVLDGDLRLEVAKDLMMCSVPCIVVTRDEIRKINAMRERARTWPGNRP